MGHKAMFSIAFTLVSWLILRPWRWRRHVPLKYPLTLTNYTKLYPRRQKSSKYLWTTTKLRHKNVSFCKDLRPKSRSQRGMGYINPWKLQPWTKTRLNNIEHHKSVRILLPSKDDIFKDTGCLFFCRLMKLDIYYTNIYFLLAWVSPCREETSIIINGCLHIQ
jgi:hypothetical protein